MKKIYALCFLLLSSCATPASNPAPKDAFLVPPAVHGHRGARWMRPENTIPAFLYALDQGVDVLELDLGVTKDNVLVVYHDQVMNSEICRYKNGKEIKGQIPIHTLTLKQVKKFDCGAKKNPRFPEQVPVPGTEIPTLDEFFAAVAKHPNGPTVKFNIEMKSEFNFPAYAPAPKKFASLMIAALKKNGTLDRTIIQSFDPRTLRAAREIEPKCTISMLFEDRPAPPMVDQVTGYQANIISPNQEWLTAEDVQAIHARGAQVAPWTANTEAEWKRLIEFGVDAIITDNPKALLEYLRARTKRPIRGSQAQEAVMGTGGLN